MQYSTSDISKILSLPSNNIAKEINVLLTDSRSLSFPEKTLFFALKTNTNDGHRYIRDLYEKGVRCFCVTHIPENMHGITDAIFFIVDNTLDALQSIAAYHRRRFNVPVIGITGSRGKTTIKEWLNTLLNDDYNITRSPRSYNSQTGVPLSVWKLHEETTLGIFEAGISQKGEMKALAEIIAPEIGIFTTLNSEHSDGFSSIAEKCHEKAMLLKDSKCVIYCGDNHIIRDVITTTRPAREDLWWSTINQNAPLYINIAETDSNSSTLKYRFNSQENTLCIPFTKSADIENICHCLATLLYFGISNDIIAERIKRLKPVETRLNVIEGKNDCMIIHDSFTSDIDSLSPALDFMTRRLTPHHSTTVIISDLDHHSLPENEAYDRLSQLLKSKRISRMIGIGPVIKKYAAILPANAEYYTDTATFLSSASDKDFISSLILIKGSPEFQFYRIADMLEARQHETVLEVNLDSIVHNFNLFRAKVKQTTGIICMVKASGYGAGSYELAKTLQSQGAAYLAVAVLDEGVDLRRAGITMPIMVLNPKVVNYHQLFTHKLEPEIFSFDILNEIISEGKRHGIKNYPVHIKLDTGMHRLGFLEKDIPQVLETLRNQDVIKAESVFSHLAVADAPQMDDYTMEQFAIFDRCSTMLQNGLPYYVKRHILNSTGISRFPQYQYDMVRLGICLYGIPTMNDGSQAGLRQVSSLSTAIISIKDWCSGTTIGYNRNGVCHRDSRIATIPIGYADGINRHLGNGHMLVMVNGHRCPTIGNVCMDACMIDVTDVECAVGDRVEIFGENIPVTEIAETLDTIPYEILTSVSSRVKRTYYRE
ncbi:MAG: bifunctional UDP-N-acetylmuramoyl-tripeptide:D-alanyl-D-alanine ligase/alanine racemase [Paramuribaculum sp.]|nr:bifunctional UDP-N-acetylmuramoyl-tripeptide:D-alanyl-D-alanine ligase/alanine racemase [Paramuribaculum sp.]